MKKLTSVILLVSVLLTAVFAGCGSTSSVWYGYRTGAVQRQNSDMVSLSCEEFTGGVTYTIRVTDQQKLTIDSDITVENGSLEVTILDAEENALFYGRIEEDWSFNTFLPDYGTYSIQIAAEEFKGSYEFSWKN